MWVLRGDEVEKELYIGETKQPAMYQKKCPCLLIHFQSIMHGRHDISLISCYLNKDGLVAYMGAA